MVSPMSMWQGSPCGQILDEPLLLAGCGALAGWLYVPLREASRRSFPTAGPSETATVLLRVMVRDPEAFGCVAVPVELGGLVSVVERVLAELGTRLTSVTLDERLSPPPTPATFER
jgi:hypothetical protein